MSVVIQVDRLSKQYRLGTIGGKRLVDDVNRWCARLRGKEDPLSKIGEGRAKAYIRKETAEKSNGESDTIYALKDVSFEVKQGEVLGIIGRNGAGKSTLLKVLSRVTAPSSGEVRVKGRIASLLEVGTGFHPELTGHENIFLNGAILGMTKAEIRSKFDDIVAFAEIEKFIDTPVKRYSSGMYVRLAFAVAAHLEPEILIVDEVLAVGDAEFQRKCLGKMRDVAGEGRTVLFVSHNMSAITQLCDSAVLLKGGNITEKCDAETAVCSYLRSSKSTSVWTRQPQPFNHNKKLYFIKLELQDDSGLGSCQFDVRRGFRVCMEFEVPSPLKPVELAVRIKTFDGRPVITTLLSQSDPKTSLAVFCGRYVAVVEVPRMFLMPGEYSMNVAAHAHAGEIYDLIEDVFRFTVVDTGTPYSKYGHNSAIGVVMTVLSWSIAKPE